MLIHLNSDTRENAVIEARKMITGIILQERQNPDAHYFMLDRGIYFAVEQHGKSFVVIGAESKKNWKTIPSITSPV